LQSFINGTPKLTIFTTTIILKFFSTLQDCFFLHENAQYIYGKCKKILVPAPAILKEEFYVKYPVSDIWSQQGCCISSFAYTGIAGLRKAYKKAPIKYLQLYADSTAAKLHPAKKTAELEFTDKNIW
jgi:hypothetical protein